MENYNNITYPYATIGNYNPQISKEAVEEVIKNIKAACIDLDFKSYQNTNTTGKKPETTNDPIKPVEKWIWVEGYRGTQTSRISEEKWRRK